MRDKHTNQALTDVKKDELAILENGRRQSIQSFSVIRQGNQRSDAPESRQQVAFTNRPTREFETGRVLAILIEAMNARAEDSHYASSAAADVLRTLSEQDRVGVYVLDRRGLRVLHDYHESTAGLLERLRRVSGAQGSAVDATPELLGGNPPTARLEASSQLEKRVRFLETTGALRAIASHLKYLPGRKSLVWLSAGFDIGVVIGNSHIWYKTIQEMGDSNVSVYAVDSSGLRTLPGFTADIPTRRGGNLPLPGPSRSTGANDPLWSMANATGGVLYENRNKLETAIRAAIADSEAVYSVTYSPTHSKWDGRFVPIRVEVNRKSAAVRHRSGYYAVPMKPLDAAERDKRMKDVVVSPLDATGIGLSVTGLHVSDNQISLIVVTDPMSVSFTGSGERVQGGIDICIAQVGAGQGLINQITDEVRLNLSEAQFATAVREGLAYPRQLVRVPGATGIRVVVIDHNTGHAGSLLVPLP